MHRNSKMFARRQDLKVSSPIGTADGHGLTRIASTWAWACRHRNGSEHRGSNPQSSQALVASFASIGVHPRFNRPFPVETDAHSLAVCGRSKHNSCSWSGYPNPSSCSTRSRWARTLRPTSRSRTSGSSSCCSCVSHRCPSTVSLSTSGADRVTSRFASCAPFPPGASRRSMAHRP